MNALTLVAKIRDGKKSALQEVLAQINRNPGTNPYLRLSEGLKTHCIRCAIIHDDENGDRLLVATEYDGDLDSYLQELVLISPQMGALWDNCLGYRGKEGFPEFIRANSYPTQAFYIAFRDETVQSIRSRVVARKRIEQLLDEKPALSGRLLDALSNLRPSRNVCKRLWNDLAGWANRFRESCLSIALSIVKPLAVVGETKNFPLVTSVFDPNGKAANLAPTKLDGQMITVTEVKPGRYLLLRLSMAVNEALGKYGYPPGLFAYVGTLFSFRWVLIDNNKRLIFLSVFDGSWQNYMGDFIDKIIWALDGIYKNTRDYPPGGMSQVAEFQRWILAHQYEPILFYKAYPDETVMQLIRDRRINKSMGSLLETGFDSTEVQQLSRDL